MILNHCHRYPIKYGTLTVEMLLTILEALQDNVQRKQCIACFLMQYTYIHCIKDAFLKVVCKYTTA